MTADVVPFPLRPSPSQGGGDDVVSCWCGCTRFRATVELTTSGAVVDVAPLLLCDSCGTAHVLRRS